MTFVADEFKHDYLFLKILLTLARHDNISIPIQLQLARAQYVLREEKKLFNFELYGGKLNIETVISSEQIFMNILDKILNICTSNLDLWRSLKQSLISLKTVK